MESDPAAKIDSRSLIEGRFVDQVGNGGQDTRFIQNQWPDTADETPGLEVALLEHRHSNVESLVRFLGRGVPNMGVELELHDSPANCCATHRGYRRRSVGPRGRWHGACASGSAVLSQRIMGMFPVCDIVEEQKLARPSFIGDLAGEDVR